MQRLRNAVPGRGCPSLPYIAIRSDSHESLLLGTGDSETRRLAGIQILDVSDQDRQQIRKWGSYVSSTSWHTDLQREPARKPDQLRVVEPFPEPHGIGSASIPEPPLNNSAVAPFGPHHPSLQSLGGWHSWPHFPWWAHSFLSLARWSIPSHVPLQLPTPMPSFRHPRRGLTPILNLQKAPNASAIAMPAHHGAAQTPQNQTAILPVEQAAQVLSQAKHNTIAHRSRTSHSTLRKNARKIPRAASVFPASTTLEHHLSSDYLRTNSEREPSATKDLILGATASSDTPPANSNGITTNSSAAARATSISPAVPPSPVAKELSANSTHSNDVAPGLPETLKSNVAPASSASSRNSAAPLAQPVVQMDPPARQVLEMRLASGYRPAFINVPNVTIVESCCATVRIQRSVRLPSGNSHWPFHRHARIVVGGLISRIDPQSAPIRTGAREFVRAHATVAQDGQVTSVWPVSGPVNLIPGVVKALQGWRYQPTLIDGKPVETQADVLIQFHTSPSHSALP